MEVLVVIRVSPQTATDAMLESKARPASPAGSASSFWVVPFSTEK